MNIIMEYLLNEKHLSRVIAELTEKNVSKYEDIRKEFELWLKNRTYNADNPLVVGGYTAKDIYNLDPFMDGVGVYNFMVTLRDDPAKAKECIDDGFKRK